MIYQTLNTVSDRKTVDKDEQNRRTGFVTAREIQHWTWSIPSFSGWDAL